MTFEGGGNRGDGRVVNSKHLDGCRGVSGEPALRVETGLSFVRFGATRDPEVLSEEEGQVVGDGLVGNESVPQVDVCEETSNRTVLLTRELGDHHHGSGAEIYTFG